MKDLESKIKEAVEQSLPKQVGDVLQERLKRLEYLEDFTKKQVEIIDAKTESIVNLHKNLDKFKVLEKRIETLDSEEERLKLMVRDQRILELEYKLESEIQNKEFTKGIISSLVRNTEFRSTMFGSENRQDQNGYTSGYPTSETVTKSAE